MLMRSRGLLESSPATKKKNGAVLNIKRREEDGDGPKDRRASRLGYSSFSSAFSAALFSLLMPAAMETVNRGWVRVFKIYTGM